MKLLPVLSEMIRQKRIPPALLFSGPRGSGKKKMALAFIKEVLGDSEGRKIEASTHPDVHHYYPEGKVGLHSMETMRSLCNQVALRSFASDWKFFIIHEAERMLTYSSNALLKTLEEPPPHTCLILLTTQAEKLLPTLLSRCQKVSFIPSLERKESESEKQWRELLERPQRFPQGWQAIEKIVALAEQEKHEKSTPYEREFALLDLFHAHFHQMHVNNPSRLAPLAREVSKARLGIERSMKLNIVLEYLYLKSIGS